LGISCRSSIDCIVPGLGSVSVPALQSVVSSNYDGTDCIAACIWRWMISFISDRMAQAVDLISVWLHLMSSFRFSRFAFIIPFSSSRSLSVLSCNCVSKPWLAFALTSSYCTICCMFIFGAVIKR
jgi:hypothetical protein